MSDVQNAYLDQLILTQQIANIFLKNGIKLQANILTYDDQTLFIRGSDQIPMMLIKDHISTICPKLYH